MKKRGRQVEIGSVLGDISRNFDRFSGGALDHERLLAAWGAAAGESVLDHTADVLLEKGVLRVNVDSPIWATELSALSEPYRLRVNEELGKDAVSEIRFCVTRVVVRKRDEQRRQQEDDAFYDPERIEPGELTELEIAQIENAASEIADEKLREAAISAITADMRRKKGLVTAKEREKASEGF